MSADQAKLVHQFILFIITFLHLVDEYKEKTHIYYFISRTVSEEVRRWLTRHNKTYS